MSASIIERTRSALRRLGTPACDKCGKLMPGIPGRVCDDCMADEARESDRRFRDMAAQDLAAVEARGSSEAYRRALDDYGDLIEESLGDWQFGNGIVGRRGGD